MAPHATGEAIDAKPDLQDRQTIKETPGYRSLPLPNPCLSYWHRTTRAWPYLNANGNSPVPPFAQYLIIGSGLSGALTAWFLVERGVTARDILILEAREAVSGASGRNAGHVRPDAFRGFVAYSNIHGDEQAKKIIENEKLAFEKLDAFVKEHDVSCDFNSTTTFDVCLTEDFARYEADSFEAYKTAGGDVSHVHFFEGDEAKARTKVRDAVAAYEWPAGSSHPAKLAQWLLGQLIEQGAQLWTHCPAVEISEHNSCADDRGRWDVQTPRGTITAEYVVHCSNAYTSHLLPELSTFITPNRAQATSFVPRKGLSGSNAVKSTMSLRYSLRHFFSFIQRIGDGTVVFGVSRLNPEWSQATKDSIVTFDDRSSQDEIAASTERGFATLFPNDEAELRRHGEGDGHAWSGVIAMTPDSVPLVGAVDGKEGQFICAGHNGHGMARIWTCAPGVVQLIMGEDWAATGLPECFSYSRARLQRAAQRSVKSVW